MRHIMNRIKDYYETAILYWKLPDMARFIINIQFHPVGFKEFLLNEEEISVKLFKQVLEKRQYREFNARIRKYKDHGLNK